MIKRLLLFGLLTVVALVLVVAGGMYWAVSSTLPHYTAALQKPPAALEESSRQLETRFTTLHSDVQSQGKWHTVISDDELNGWLAVKLPESFPKLLPKEIHDPRVAITPAQVILAARSEMAGVDAVVSVFVEPYVTEEGDLAVELHQVLAGALPVPTKELVDRVALATRRSGLPVRWTQSGGKTVMIVARELWDRKEKQNRVLEAIELADGKMFLSGRTEQLPDAEHQQQPLIAPAPKVAQKSTPRAKALPATTR